MEKRKIDENYGSIMILVPHQDDEILMCAGMIDSAVRHHVPLTVVMATNGDYGCSDLSVGRARLRETLEGLKVLGVSEEQVVFLGYADTGMPAEESFLYGLYHETRGDQVHPSHCSDHTYALPEKEEFHKIQYGEHGSYTRNTFAADLKAVLLQYRPEHIFTTAAEDIHGDHSGLFLFVREALQECAVDGYHPRLYCGLVHSGAGDENWPARGGGVSPIESPELVSRRGFLGKEANEQNCLGSLTWEDRIVFPVPDSMLTGELVENKKAVALSKHVTALKPDAVDFLYAFIKAEEIFWEIDVVTAAERKLREPIYPIEPWDITEEAFRMEHVYRNETTFALSNGYIGTRGTYEESYDFSEEEGLEGNFINGFYESEQIRYGEWNYGFPEKSQSLLNLPDLKTVKLFVGEEEFDMREGELILSRRVLHMKEGVLERNVEWQSPSGKRVRIRSRRFVSFACKNLMAMSYEVTPVNFTGAVRLVSALDAEVENHTRKTNPLVDYGPFGKHLVTKKIKAEGEILYYEGKTKNSGLAMACGSRHIVSGAACGVHEECSGSRAWLTFETEGSKGQPLTLYKWIAYTKASDLEQGERGMKPLIEKVLQEAETKGFEALIEEQKAYMEAFWDRADVQVKGDAALQQGIRFNLFHIMQAAGRDGKTGMGAKGLSGEGYEGHYFWDTEMYVLPVFAYTDPALAKSLLDFRYDTLEEARRRARVLGHEKGALYPWRTINGQEASTYFPLGTAQYHINADIAYAFKLYVDVSGDYEYLQERAAEVLVETARVWADVGCFVSSKGGRYCICAVTGPDEYNAIVDNNFYTNLMARENIRDALWALRIIGEKNRAALDELVQRLHVTQEETVYWEKIVENMYFPYDEERRVYPLDDGFLMRKPWDDSKIPPEKRHLLYENYHPLFVYRQQMSKQADAILGMLLHSDLFSKEELRRNYDFYQEVTLHHSSLSTCIFGMLASRIGYEEEACRYFAQSARMDLDDYHENFYAGIHAANMAGTWQAIVFGFGGVRVHGGTLLIEPSLPREWEGYSFRIEYQGQSLQVTVGKERTEVELLGAGTVSFMCRGSSITLDGKGDMWIETV